MTTDREAVVLVLVTGGSGFVGSHTVRALLRSGRDVRALVRDEHRARDALAAVGVADDPGLELVRGDVTDRCSVAAVLAGADAVVHGAAVFSFNRRDWPGMWTVNATAAEQVVRMATDAGADPVVHVSSIVAMLPEQAGGRLDPDNAPTTGDPPGRYVASKTAGETAVRQLQRDGAPVVITYPGSVHGPHDPHMGESAHHVAMALRRLLPVVPRGGLHVSDVRDVAALHAAVLEPGRGPRRLVAPGHYVEIVELHRRLARLTGRRIPTVAVPGRTLMGPLSLLQRAQSRAARHYPGDPEAVWLIARAARSSCAAAAEQLGVHARPTDDTLADEVRWLAGEGHVARRAAGRLLR